ncbi:MAG: DUF1778 domain-containing protein [Oscillatoria princeps RMCB-10]|jgi:uncharacterized protein (DUF1778 family)|nr:DUF1778 domain-containing protein [Oscillatoria princeps RMCB-10]
MQTNANQKTSKKKPKLSRIELRISPEQKELLEKAASLASLSLSSYMVYHCLEAAREDIKSHQSLILSDRDRDLFLSLMENPPEPNQALKSAMRKFQEECES